MSGNFVIDVLLGVMVVVAAGAVYKLYKVRKADDGKIDLRDIIAILIKLNDEIRQVLEYFEEAKLSGKLNTVEEQRLYIANKLEFLIVSSETIAQEDKDLILGFGMENIAKLIIKRVD